VKNNNEILETNVCFRCGEIEPMVDPFEEPQPYKMCLSCGDYGVVKIKQLIDIVNDLELKGILGLALSVVDQEEFVDAISFRDVDTLTEYTDD